MITVFTPTYNRAHILANAYQSLLSQTTKNFEWLVVDDGSIDDTKSLINTWIKERKIIIRYIFQENQGKHIAINTAAQHAKGKYILTLDSDDMLLESCIEEISPICEEIEHDSLIAGCIFFRISGNYNNFPNNEGVESKVICREKDFVYRTSFKKEAVFCVKTTILINYPFPQFDGERFMPESVVLKKITNQYDFVFYKKVLAKGSYLEDGLTSQYWELLKKNPKGAMLFFKQKIEHANSHIAIKSYVRSYWSIALNAKHIPWLEKFRGIPLKHSFIYWFNRFFAKINSHSVVPPFF